MRVFCIIVVGLLYSSGFGLSIAFQRIYAPGDGLWVAAIAMVWFCVAWLTFRWIWNFKRDTAVPKPTKDYAAKKSYWLGK